MTLLAGFLNRVQDRPLPGDLCEAIADAIGRTASREEEISTVRSGGLFLAKLDIGAFPGGGLLAEDEWTAALTGEPLFGQGRSGRRDEDLAHLVRQWRAGELDRLLRSATGVYSAVLYDHARHELVLITDRLGVRPVFVAETDERIYFSSALNILEQLDVVPKVVDLRGVVEKSSFGTPLGNRTPYASIAILRDGEYRRTVGGDRLETSIYWRWDAIPSSDRPAEAQLESVYSAFESAIRRRLADANRADAALSGGLDSRAIVCVLRSLVSDLRTFNFSIAGSKDAIYGRGFAEYLGTEHHQVDLKPGRAEFVRWLAEKLHGLGDPNELAAGAGRVAWAGDGGSVGLGHVYVSETMVSALREQGVEAAVRHWQRGQDSFVPRPVLASRADQELRDVPTEGLLAELNSVHPDDPGRAAFLFFLRNDQRRHLAGHFESIHETRLELQLPFFDSAFLEAVLRVPLNALLRHAFYVHWTELLPCDMTAVPWQVYPGHVAPAFDEPTDLTDQWRDPRPPEWTRYRREQQLRTGERVLATNPFPRPVLRRPMVRIAYWLTRLGIRDVGYLLGTAEDYATYWARAGGRAVWPSGDPVGP